MSKILVVAKGSYGDVFPLYALALELRGRGHEVTFATQRKHERATRSLGFPVVILDGHGQDSAGRIPKQLPAHFFSGNLRFETHALLEAVPRTDIVLGNQLAYFAPLVAKKFGKRWIYCPVSPLALPSRHQVTLFPYLQGLQRLTVQYPQLQGLYLSLGRGASRLMMQGVVNQRRSLDAADQLHPQFEGMYSPDLNLLLTSPLLAEKQCDWPASTHVTGFTWFDAAFLGNDEKNTRINRFLDAGAPPVVFALAGTARAAPGSFFQTGIEACHLLGLRAMVVTATRFHSRLNSPEDVLVTDYLPFPGLFPRVRAVVHSGGIGTLGWCLKYNIPSLLVPTHVDQFNNAYHAADKGFAEVIFDAGYSASSVASALSGLIGDERKRQSLKAASGTVAKEDGAKVASDYIEKFC